MKLNEFAVGKADFVATKVFSILSRRTGVKFKLKKSLIPYSNRWGKFLGKFAAASDGRCFRLNFIRGASDIAVSLEVWAKGKNPFSALPNKVLSFEGWPITRIVFQAEGFINGLDLNEAVEYELDETHRLQEETVKEVFGMYAAEYPGAIADIAKGGFDEADMFAKLKSYIGVNKLKVAGLAKHTLASAIWSYLKAAAKGQAQSGINRSQAAAAAQAVPVAKVVDGSSEGVNTLDKNLYDILDPVLAQTVGGLISEINEDTGAIGVIRQYERQLKIAVARNTGARLVVACGRAGTGKTYSTKRFLQYGEGMGLSPGSGFYEAQGIKFDDEDDVTALFCLNQDVPVIIFDDADQLFISKSVGIQNIMKHVLDPDRENRVLNVPKDFKTKAGNVVAGNYTIDCKLIWCTNKRPEELNAAVRDRMMKPANVFNFTDQEILDMIKDNLSGVYDEYPGLTEKEITDVFIFFQSVVNDLSKKGSYNQMHTSVSFRNFRAVLDEMETCKLLNLSVGEVWAKLAKSFGISIKKPAQVLAGA